MTDFPKLAGPSVLQIPDGDNRERLTCPDCGFINYENPKTVVGAVCTWDSRLLLCRRAIDPRRGFDDPCWVHGTERNRRGRYPPRSKRRSLRRYRYRWFDRRVQHTADQVQLIYRATVKDGAEAPVTKRKNWTCSAGTISRGTIWHFHPSNGRWIIGVKLPGRIHGAVFQPPGQDELFIVTRRNADADQALSSAGGNACLRSSRGWHDQAVHRSIRRLRCFRYRSRF